MRVTRPRQYQLEVEVDGNYQVDLPFDRTAGDGTVSTETCRVFISVEEVQQQGCKSEFERLIRANRRLIQPAEARTIVQPDRNSRSSSLQDWMLSAELASRSFLPIVLAEDYIDAWVQPSWTEAAGPVFSKGRFLKDPRPMPSEFQPPDGFVEARAEIAARIRGKGDETGLVESAQLGKWIWHRHEGCNVATTPKSNTAFWIEKFERTVRRDARASAELAAMNWRVLVAWECELDSKRKVDGAVVRLSKLIRDQSAGGATRLKGVTELPR